MGLMTASSGLTNSKLALANATADQVSNGRTFYAGDKALKTGSLQERGQFQYAGGVGSGVFDDIPYIALNDIPEGIYRKNGAAWAPEVRAPSSQVGGVIQKNVTGTFTVTSPFIEEGLCYGRGRVTYSVSGNVITFTLYGGCQRSGWAHFEERSTTFRVIIG